MKVTYKEIESMLRKRNVRVAIDFETMQYVIVDYRGLLPQKLTHTHSYAKKDQALYAAHSLVFGEHASIR